MLVLGSLELDRMRLTAMGRGSHLSPLGSWHRNSSWQWPSNGWLLGLGLQREGQSRRVLLEMVVSTHSGRPQVRPRERVASGKAHHTMDATLGTGRTGQVTQHPEIAIKGQRWTGGGAQW